MRIAMIALFVLCLGLAWFDHKSARIPNSVTFPLLAAGLWLHFPGSPEIWLAAALLLYGWKHRWLGGGDAKLWLALLWLAPGEVVHPGAILGGVWMVTGLLQLVYRASTGIRLLGIKRPGAWRALPFAAWLALVS
jgi:Flp pilus assembly protein protease CpaA